MWKDTNDSPYSTTMSEGDNELRADIEFAINNKDREEIDDLIALFVRCVKFKEPIPKPLMSFVADLLDELSRGKNVVKVSQVLGTRPKGSRGIYSREKERHHNKIAELYAKNKVMGLGRTENISKTAEACGTTTRTVENVVARRAVTQPYFKYENDEKI